MCFSMSVRTDNCIFSFLSQVFQGILLMILFQDSTILVWKISAAKKSFSGSIASPHFSNVFRFSWWQNSKMSINFTNTRNIFFRYLLTFFQNLYRCLKIRFLSSLTVWVNRGKRYLFFKGFAVTVLKICCSTIIYLPIFIFSLAFAKGRGQ